MVENVNEMVEFLDFHYNKEFGCWIVEEKIGDEYEGECFDSREDAVEYLNRLLNR